jgi:hypothetical protein
MVVGLSPHPRPPPIIPAAGRACPPPRRGATRCSGPSKRRRPFGLLPTRHRWRGTALLPASFAFRFEIATRGCSGRLRSDIRSVCGNTTRPVPQSHIKLPGSRPSKYCPTVSKCSCLPCNCCDTVWMSRKRRRVLLEDRGSRSRMGRRKRPLCKPPFGRQRAPRHRHPSRPLLSPHCRHGVAERGCDPALAVDDQRLDRSEPVLHPVRSGAVPALCGRRPTPS